MASAYAVRDRWPVAEAGASLSIPTWFYGHEPSNLFATGIAKYFANALREDTLLHRCRGGIVYLPGQAGTVQEIFQAVTENFYAADRDPDRPDGAGREWTTGPSACPPGRCSQRLAADRPMAEAIHCVDDIAAAADLLYARLGRSADSQVPARLRPARRQRRARELLSVNPPTKEIPVASKKTAVAVAAGVLALGAGVGDRRCRLGRPHPDTQPDGHRHRRLPGTDRPGGGRHGGGFRDGAQVTELASKLGVTEEQLTEALRAIREENRSTDSARPTRPGSSATRPWPRRWPRS